MKSDAIDPTEVPLGMYDQPNNEFTVRSVEYKFDGRYEVTVPEHDRHVRSAIYEFSGLEPMIAWIRKFDEKLRSKT